MILAGQPRSGIGRLKIDGTLDGGFNPVVGGVSKPTVSSVAVQADGKILVGGSFATLNGQPRKRIGRLNMDGTLDVGFDVSAEGGAYPSINTLALQADGKILVGGEFTRLGSQVRNWLGRLNPDGTVDSEFNPGANKAVSSLAVQADGKVLVGGSFTSLGGQPRNCIARLSATEPAIQSLVYSEATITWLRGGTSPEISRCSFDCTTNGINWVSLGAGVRISGGWHLANVYIPGNATLKARGYAVGGNLNGSSWFVEATLILTNDLNSPLKFLVNDGSFGIRSNRFGFSLSGNASQTIMVDVSTNLQRWAPLSTNSSNGTPLYFSEPYYRDLPTRFYRLRLRP